MHDVVLNLLSDAPALAVMPRRFPVDSLIRLTERHFPEQTQYDGPQPKGSMYQRDVEYVQQGRRRQQLDIQ